MTLSIYPLAFAPIFKPKPWGGNKLASLLGKPCDPHQRIGESWEISDRGLDSTRVAAGPYRGKTIHDLLLFMEHRLVGDLVWAKHGRRFPLLYKLLDVEALLSVQVHPGDAYAAEHAGDRGKTEMWYVLQADPGAGIICGLKEGINRKKFRAALRDRTVDKVLGQYPVRAGESYFIPPGRVHTISPPCLIVEIQVSSDVTYRVYDWGRVGVDGRERDLHVRQALDVIDFQDRGTPLLEPISEKTGRNRESLLVACDEFTVEKFDLEEASPDCCGGRHFQVLTGLEGRGDLEVARLPGQAWPLGPGDFYLLPAYLGEYRIIPRGRFSFLKSYST